MKTARRLEDYLKSVLVGSESVSIFFNASNTFVIDCAVTEMFMGICCYYDLFEVTSSLYLYGPLHYSCIRLHIER